MKKVVRLFLLIAAVFSMVTFASCNSCSKENENPSDSIPAVVESLDVQALMVSDYDYIASQYQSFFFYEGDVHFDQTLDNPDAVVDAFRTIFQVGDTCIAIDHRLGGIDDTIKTEGIWVGCVDLNPRVPVDFDSCMTIVAAERANLHTQFVTFRRLMAPPFPEHGWWIFGKGIYAIDSYTGEPVMNIYSFNPDENLRLGCPLGEWP